MINPNTPPVEWGIVKVYRPVGCDRTSLSLKAFTFTDRQTAQETFVVFNSQMISCTSFVVDAFGDLILRIPPSGFELVGDEKEPS